MLNKKTLKDLELEGKKVFLRVDFNVPMDNQLITDHTRITAALPTIDYLLEHGAAVILASHLGRPGGKVDKEFSLKPVADYLANFRPEKISFAEDCRGEVAKKAAKNLKLGQVLLLENTRFYPGEELNEPQMGRELAELADLFVNDAFGTAHRAHASNVGIAEYLPSAAGLLLEKEINYLDNCLANPERPFIAILGGAKVSGKIGVINHLIGLVDWILIGGGMANTFFASQGYEMGNSLVEENSIPQARQLLTEAGSTLVLPVDMVVADSFSAEAKYKTMAVGDVPPGWMIMDIGSETIEKYADLIGKSKTIVWNGPMGVFEYPAFATGTNKIANRVAESQAVSIVGGGDSAAAVVQAGLIDRITHISTGGGASLEMLEGQSLPGVEALDDK